MPRNQSPFARSAVYNAQVKSFTIARLLAGDSCQLLRILKQYRTEASRQVRSDTAAAVRGIRRSKQPFPLPPSCGHVSVMP